MTVVWLERDANQVASAPADGPSVVGKGEDPCARLNPGLSQDEPAPVSGAPRLVEAQRDWDWTIAMYLYLVGLGCGAFAVAVVTDWFGPGFHPAATESIRGWSWDWSQALVWWGPAAAAVGAVFVLVHLGRNWLLFPTAWRNWRVAWMARGFVVLALFITVGMVVAAIAVLAPGWPSRFPILWRLLQGVGLILALGTAVYTGVLLWSKSQIPAWATALIPLLFLVSALSSGLAGQALGVVAHDAMPSVPHSARSLLRTLEGMTSLFIVAQAWLLVLYVGRLRSGGAPARASLERLVHGALGATFWVPVVGGSLLLPLVLIAVESATGARLWAAVSSASVLIGAFYLRLAVLRIGIGEAPPLYAFSEWRGDHSVESHGASSKVPNRVG